MNGLNNCCTGAGIRIFKYEALHTVTSLNSKVILRTFNGSLVPPVECSPGENYWALIGETGTVVEPKNARARVLVKFDASVVAFGLHCHNVVPNSLYILESDLEVLS